MLDATKLIPEEMVPLKKVGTMVLDRNPDNFFAETEQVAFCPANIVPGIDFSNDPLLQGRLFSYLDTQLIRLGGPNFHQIPVNAPKCPMHNFQRDGHMQTAVPKGRVAYEPSTLAAGPRGEPSSRLSHVRAQRSAATRLRVRPEAFADHYTQARLFWSSQTESEQDAHRVRLRLRAQQGGDARDSRARPHHLVHVDRGLAERVTNGLGLANVPSAAPARVQPKKTSPSSALSIVKKAKLTLEGRSVACLVTNGADAGLLDALSKAVAAAGAEFVVVAPKVSGVRRSDKKPISVDGQLAGSPSVLFDAVLLVLGPDGRRTLAGDSAALAFVYDAFQHLKVVGFNESANPLLGAAGVEKDEGFVDLDGRRGVQDFIDTAKRHRIWDREPKVRPPL